MCKTHGLCEFTGCIPEWCESTIAPLFQDDLVLIYDTLEGVGKFNIK